MTRILVVEDNPESQYMLKQLLETKGHIVVTADHGEQALEYARQDPPEMIVSDIMMPVMNGFKLCREVKKDEILRAVPFVFYTATFVEERDRQLGMSLGASRFVIKPMDGLELINILDQVLEEHRQGILAVPQTPWEDGDALLEMYENALACKLEQTVEKLKHEQQALKKSEKRLKDAQEIAQMGHWELDLKTNALVWSDEIYRIFGLTPQKCTATYEFFLAALHPEDRADVDKAYQDSLVKKTQYDIDHRLMLNDGTVKWVHGRCQTLYDDNGDPTYSIGTIQDITERKKLEAQLRQSQKMEAIGTLAGGIAHDFNNILSIILGYAELSVSSINESEEVLQANNQIINAASRAKDLVRQILMFSRQSDSELKPIRIQSILKETLKFLRASIPTTIDIEQDIDPVCNPVLANSTQIHQVAMNLCTNAYHSMRDTGGILYISLKPVELFSEKRIDGITLRPGCYAKFEIKDTGCGISKENLKKIFEPYFTTKEKGEGTGLGLAVVHGIIISFGGQITVNSTPGIGTKFEIYLPTIKEIDRKALENDTRQILTGNEQILVVDDDESLSKLLKKMLENLGYKVTALTNSVDTLKLFKKKTNEFDLVITDMTMPNMPGDKLAREIRKINPECPVIMCTGFNENMTQEKAKALGVKALLMKPVSKSELAQTIRRVLGD